METASVQVHIGSRLEEFQAAAACLSVKPLLRTAAHYCWIVGVVVLLAMGARSQLSLSSPAMWENLALIAIGAYLYSPNPQPVALLMGAAAILGNLGLLGYEGYVIWQRTHNVIHVNPIGVLIELAVALRLIANYFSYRKNLAATTVETIDELKSLALATSKADPEQDPSIVELKRRDVRVHLGRLEDLILLVQGHRIAFGMRSYLDLVVLAKRESVAIEMAGEGKPGRGLKVKISNLKGKGNIFRMKPEYASRLKAMGIPLAGWTGD